VANQLFLEQFQFWPIIATYFVAAHVLDWQTPDLKGCHHRKPSPAPKIRTTSAAPRRACCKHVTAHARLLDLPSSRTL
jgi:hypothetical protein